MTMGLQADCCDNFKFSILTDTMVTKAALIAGTLMNVTAEAGWRPGFDR